MTAEDQPRPEDREGPPDTRPYLCIPYWTTPVVSGGSWDTGLDRPLPGAVVSYLCAGIHAGPYVPGEPLEVGVDVRNSGGGSSAAVATVVVYWADPTAGFAKPRFFAASVVAVEPSRTAPVSKRTPTMTAVIPADAPAHICLLVAVSHAQDRAGTVADPVGDRHWAQRNLQAAAVAPGAPTILPFTVGNPFERERSFVLHVGPADRRHAARVAGELGMEPTDVPATLRLLDEDGAEIGEGGEQARLAFGLGPREARPLQLLVQVDAEVPPGRGVPLAALLFAEGGEREGLVGGLGMVLLGPDG